MSEFEVTRASRGIAPSMALDIRRKVFIEGQGVPEDREQDGLDGDADHYLAYADHIPVATARVRYYEGENAAKIERVAVLAEYQGKKYGQLLMRGILLDLTERGIDKAQLESQVSAREFYERLGFQATSEHIFMDAGIEHIRMARSLG